MQREYKKTLLPSLLLYMISPISSRVNMGEKFSQYIQRGIRKTPLLVLLVMSVFN